MVIRSTAGGWEVELNERNDTIVNKSECECNKIEIDGKYYLKEIDTLNIYSIDGDNDYLGKLIDGKINK